MGTSFWIFRAVLDAAYDRAGYDLELDYSADPVPPLDGEWNAWAHRLLKEKVCAGLIRLAAAPGFPCSKLKRLVSLGVIIDIFIPVVGPQSGMTESVVLMSHCGSCSRT